jgi:hypothetical protein
MVGDIANTPHPYGLQFSLRPLRVLREKEMCWRWLLIIQPYDHREEAVP